MVRCTFPKKFRLLLSGTRRCLYRNQDLLEIKLQMAARCSQVELLQLSLGSNSLFNFLLILVVRPSNQTWRTEMVVLCAWVHLQSPSLNLSIDQIRPRITAEVAFTTFVSLLIAALYLIDGSNLNSTQPSITADRIVFDQNSATRGGSVYTKNYGSGSVQLLPLC